LSAFICGSNPIPANGVCPAAPPKLDIQAAVSVLLRRDPSQDQDATVDLRATCLVGVDFSTDLVHQGSYGQDVHPSLIGADFAHADLTGADFDGQFDNSIDMTAADFVGAKLTRARLEQMRLSSADLTSADLSGADLRGAALDDAILTSATGVNLHGTTGQPVR
jgi:uncharacterized protein YjbI with pentapeptide repeats